MLSIEMTQIYIGYIILYTYQVDPVVGCLKQGKSVRYFSLEQCLFSASPMILFLEVSAQYFSTVDQGSIER